MPCENAPIKKNPVHQIEKHTKNGFFNQHHSAQRIDISIGQIQILFLKMRKPEQKRLEILQTVHVRAEDFGDLDFAVFGLVVFKDAAQSAGGGDRR